MMDLRYALRLLVKSPLFTIAIVNSSKRRPEQFRTHTTSWRLMSGGTPYASARTLC